MAKRQPKLVYSIICDDIREEVGNKLSYMGVYGAEINVPKLPYVFPQICTAVFFSNLKGGDSFEITAKGISGKPFGEPIKGNVPKEVKSKINLALLAKFAPIKVDNEGTVNIEIVFNGDKSAMQRVEIAIKLRK